MIFVCQGILVHRSTEPYTKLLSKGLQYLISTLIHSWRHRSIHFLRLWFRTSTKPHHGTHYILYVFQNQHSFFKSRDQATRELGRVGGGGFCCSPSRDRVWSRKYALPKCTYHKRITRSWYAYSKVHLTQLGQGVIPGTHLFHIRRIVLRQLLVQIRATSLNR